MTFLSSKKNVHLHALVRDGLLRVGVGYFPGGEGHFLKLFNMLWELKNFRSAMYALHRNFWFGKCCNQTKALPAKLETTKKMDPWPLPTKLSKDIHGLSMGILNTFRHQMARRLSGEDFNQTNLDDFVVRVFSLIWGSHVFNFYFHAFL